MNTLKMIIAICVALLLFGIGPAFATHFNPSEEVISTPTDMEKTPNVDPSK